MKTRKYIMDVIRSLLKKMFDDAPLFVVSSFIILILFFEKDTKPIHLQFALGHNIHWLCKTNLAMISIRHRQRLARVRL